MSDSLASALAAFQAELPTLGKGNVARVEGKEGKAGYSYRYADLADVTKVVLPLLAKHGLSFSSKPTVDDGRFVLIYTLRHVSGESDGGVYPLPINATPQQTGSAISYARRYALQAMTGVAADEDDDGKAAADTKVDLTAAYTSTRDYAWDPTEQENLVAAYMAELNDAKSTGDITAIGVRVGSAKRAGELSPVSVDRITRFAAACKAELNGKEARSDVAEQPALSEV